MNRLAVRKTYKLYINGEFPRTESGAVHPVMGLKGDRVIKRLPRIARDLATPWSRRARLSGWADAPPTTAGRSSIRIAEVCESRAAELEKERSAGGCPRCEERSRADHRHLGSTYAGWSDKYTQLFGTVNPGPGRGDYNFISWCPSLLTGVAGIVALGRIFSSLLGLCARVASAISERQYRGRAARAKPFRPSPPKPFATSMFPPV